MQFYTAKTKFVRISPKKARLAAGLIRGLSVEQATLQLRYSQLKGGRLLGKTLDSAVANAQSQQDIDRKKIMIHEVRVDQGPSLKRAKPKNRGGRAPILKRMSHFTIVLATE